MARRRPEFESGEAGVEAAQPERLGDAEGSQIQWLLRQRQDQFSKHERYNDEME